MTLIPHLLPYRALRPIHQVVSYSPSKHLYQQDRAIPSQAMRIAAGQALSPSHLSPSPLLTFSSYSRRHVIGKGKSCPTALWKYLEVGHAASCRSEACRAVVVEWQMQPWDFILWSGGSSPPSKSKTTRILSPLPCAKMHRKLQGCSRKAVL